MPINFFSDWVCQEPGYWSRQTGDNTWIDAKLIGIEWFLYERTWQNGTMVEVELPDGPFNLLRDAKAAAEI